MLHIIIPFKETGISDRSKFLTTFHDELNKYMNKYKYNRKLNFER